MTYVDKDSIKAQMLIIAAYTQPWHIFVAK